MLLALLGPATDEDYESVAVLTEINPIARAEVDSIFENTGSDAFHFREISLLDSHNGDRNFGGSLAIEVIKPVPVEAVAGSVEIFANLDHVLMVTHMTPLSKERCLAEVFGDFAGGVVAAGAGNAVAGVGAVAAEVEMFYGGGVAGPA